ncbi:DUF4276 family protein [Sorangium sp. So ce1389]|uniref:DUF4276 family protein n=1 Tax=Sorangium sp. So ce1389 TaxID=3133336 RepID=UPI003F5FCF29
MKGYILVEGEGELGAVENLVTRLWQEAGHWQPWAPAITCKNTHQRRGIEKGIGYVRAKRDAGALLILRDEDDACPKQRGPEMALWARELQPPFPVAVVLLHREYEVLFLPCLELMAGRPLIGPDGQERPGLLPGTRWEHGEDWERKRGLKEWLSERFPAGRIYKPRFDQWPMTRMIDLPTLRAAGVSCFGTLERALAFLASSFGRPGVYPPSGG